MGRMGLTQMLEQKGSLLTQRPLCLVFAICGCIGFAFGLSTSTWQVTVEVGQVLALAPAVEKAQLAFAVGCGEGTLGVSRVQLEGRQAMAAAEFFRGQRDFIGVTLPSPPRGESLPT